MQTMLEDKLRETDWELTQDTIEEQVFTKTSLPYIHNHISATPSPHIHHTITKYPPNHHHISITPSPHIHLIITPNPSHHHISTTPSPRIHFIITTCPSHHHHISITPSPTSTKYKIFIFTLLACFN